MNTKAVIFDLDGVVIHSEQIWYDAMIEFYREHGKEYSSGIREMLMGTSQQFSGQFIKDDLGLGSDWPPEKVITTIIDRVKVGYQNNLRLVDGYMDLMKQIMETDVRRGLASGARPDLIEHAITEFKLYDHFESTMSGDMVKHPKPAPDVYLEVAKRLNVEPERCVGIEDSPKGVQSVKAAGMRCVAIPDKFLKDHDAFAGADVIREDLTLVTLHDLGIQ
ncbi:MAG: HAD family phosphatase [Candidatus Kerfeldbacteria bacterium]